MVGIPRSRKRWLPLDGGRFSYEIVDVIVSRKRDDVMAICDHMQICPKNPLVILTQDKARSFLASSSPQEKYNVCNIWRVRHDNNPGASFSQYLF